MPLTEIRKQVEAAKAANKLIMDAWKCGDLRACEAAQKKAATIVHPSQQEEIRK